MSKSKSKGSKVATKPETATMLNKVGAGAVTKPTQTPKMKSKEVAKKVAAKDAKKPKKVVKEPTPEPSDSESEESASSASSEDESDEEIPVSKPVQNGKTNGIAKVAAVSKEIESEEDSEAESDSEDELPAKGADLKTAIAAPAVEDSDEADSEDESDEEEEPTKDKGPIKATDLAKKLTPIAAPESSEDDSEAESEADSDDGEDDSESDDIEEVETKPTPAAKRKAEEAAAPASKKTKTAEVESNGNQHGNLFVGSLSWNVDEEWLTREFEEFGELSGVRIITDRETGRSKGFGYVEFANSEDAAKAHAAKNGAMVDGRAINVDFAQPRSSGGQQDRAQSRAQNYGDSTSSPSDTLFVGNLSFDADQDAVSQAFMDFGTVISVRLPTDRETGSPKGFGYVTFSLVDEAKAALEGMQGAEISGRACRLDFSQPRPSNGDSPARGGRGGGRGFGDRGGRGGRGRGGFGDRGGRGGGRGRGGFGERGGRGGRGGSTNRGGFGDFAGKKTTF